ncbi:hypothetical protein LBMAG56_34500 [Verrucomicrobiota bacterium]|nr:hypothetical protein LBMAG56_34500 [Verrucomicrobiota bacterium]
MFSLIPHEPLSMAGRACIRGMRIPVSLVVNLVSNEMTPAQIIADFPDLTREDITEALRYTACLANEEVNPFASVPALAGTV